VMSIPGFSVRGAAGSARGQSGMGQVPGMPGMPMGGRRFGSRFEPTQVNQPGPKRTVKWLIAVEGNTPLKIVVTSQKGGTKVKELSIGTGGAR